MAFVTLICGVANAFYGFSGNPDDQSAWCESYLYPENVYQLTMRQPDGVIRVLQRDPSDAHALVCPDPWVGELRGRQALVMTRPDFEGGRTGFMFENGRLVRMILGEREIEVGPSANGVRKLADLWPVVTDQMVRDASLRFGRHWGDRFSLWYRNPNCAAMLLVEVFLLAVALFGCRRKAWWALALPLAAACFWGLVKTGSRGGLLGLLVGLGCFAAFRAKAFLNWKRLGLLGLALAGVALALYLGGATERFTVGLVREGYTDVSRIPIWLEAPRMMAASASGWGLGNSGGAYMNWFQPLDRFHCIAGLINTHLTWLVEFGWAMRALYALLWCAGLLFLARDAFRGRSVLPLALWSSFCVASFFNSLGLEWSLWVIPLAALGLHLVRRKGTRAADFLFPLVGGAALAAAVLGGLFLWGVRSAPDVAIAGDAAHVVANGSRAEIWVVDDGFALDGGYYGVLGKDVRNWYRAHRDAPAVGFVRRVEDVPRDARRLALAGRSAVDFLKAWRAEPARFKGIEELVFLSPPFPVGEIPEDLLKAHQVSAVVGGYAARLSGEADRLPEWVRVVSGCAVYINGWLRYVAK